MYKILVIEDDFDMTFILKMALANKYEARIINDTQHLLETLDEFVPDLILTDNFIGQKKAYEIIKEIRGLVRFNRIPVILFTGHPDIEKLSFEISAVAFLSKPFDLVDLYACIEKVILKIAEDKILLVHFREANSEHLLQKTLKEATRDCHAKMEQLMYADQIMNGTLSVTQYKQIVTTNYIVHKRLEEYWISALCPETADKLNIKNRRKLGSLLKDIAELKMKAPYLPLDMNPVVFDTEASVLGALYVLEGSTLGGHVIVKKLKTNPNLSGLNLNFHYYQLYGSDLIQNWMKFCEILNLQPKQTYTTSINGAKRMFEYIAFVQQSRQDIPF